MQVNRLVFAKMRNKYEQKSLPHTKRFNNSRQLIISEQLKRNTSQLLCYRLFPGAPFEFRSTISKQIGVCAPVTVSVPLVRDSLNYCACKWIQTHETYLLLAANGRKRQPTTITWANQPTTTVSWVFDGPTQLFK